MKNKQEIIAELITILCLILIVLLCSIFSSCKSTYEYNNSVQSATMIKYEYVYNKTQLDSALLSNNLPIDFENDWLKAAYIDYETNKPITQYFYYRTNNYNEITSIYEITYDIVKLDTIYNYSWKLVNTTY